MSKLFAFGFVALVVAFVGCRPFAQVATLFAPSYSVPSRFAPLKKVAALSSVARGTTTTIYTTAFTHDLDAWHRQYPKGSVEEEAVLRHEQVHARRQLEMGDVWFVRYAADRDFRWDEEKLGVGEEIRWLHQHSTGATSTSQRGQRSSTATPTVPSAGAW